MKKINFYIEATSVYSAYVIINDDEDPNDFIDLVNKEFDPYSTREEYINVSLVKIDSIEENCEDENNELHECISSDSYIN